MRLGCAFPSPPFSPGSNCWMQPAFYQAIPLSPTPHPPAPARRPPPFSLFSPPSGRRGRWPLLIAPARPRWRREAIGEKRERAASHCARPATMAERRRSSLLHGCGACRPLLIAPARVHFPRRMPPVAAAPASRPRRPRRWSKTIRWPNRGGGRNDWVVENDSVVETIMYSKCNSEVKTIRWPKRFGGRNDSVVETGKRPDPARRPLPSQPRPGDGKTRTGKTRKGKTRTGRPSGAESPL